MQETKRLPGTTGHRQLLKTILDFYAEDQRILAILLFGSLGGGNWDEYSDLDLDIIMIENISIDARLELEALCASIENESGVEAVIIADSEEGDIVLSDLRQFSIRYHLLRDTKPAILATMRLLTGTLTLDEIRNAANQKYVLPPRNMVEIVDQCLRYALELHNALMRRRLWMSIELLHRVRGLLMIMYAAANGAERSIQYFDAEASPHLREALARLHPQPDIQMIWTAFQHLLALLEDDLNGFCQWQYELTPTQKSTLRSLHQRAER